MTLWVVERLLAMEIEADSKEEAIAASYLHEPRDEMVSAWRVSAEEVTG